MPGELPFGSTYINHNSVLNTIKVPCTYPTSSDSLPYKDVKLIGNFRILGIAFRSLSKLTGGLSLCICTLSTIYGVYGIVHICVMVAALLMTEDCQGHRFNQKSFSLIAQIYTFAKYLLKNDHTTVFALNIRMICLNLIYAGNCVLTDQLNWQYL